MYVCLHKILPNPDENLNMTFKAHYNSSASIRERRDIFMAWLCGNGTRAVVAK